MTKKHSVKTTPAKTVRQEVKKQPLIPEKYQDYFFIGMIFLLVFVFFGSAIFGNGFYVSDNLASTSFDTYINKADKSGSFPQWIPYIFSGMPSFAALLTTGERIWAFIQYFFFGVVGFIGTLFASDVARLAFYYVIYGTGIYILMRTKDHERFVAFFSSVAAVFSTAVIVWVMIGHNTKPVVFSMFPFIILLLEELRKKFSILNTVLLVIVVHIMMEAGHIQMIFYGIVTFGLYLLFEFVSRLITKQNAFNVLRAAGLLVIAGVFAFLMSSDRYLSTLEYTPYSTRGVGPIEKTEGAKEQADGGNDYDYATMWSYSPGETMLFLVPNFYGFGKLEYSGSATGGKEVKLPTYWGQKPFDDAAAYMGIGVFALAILGFIFYRKDVFVQFLLVASLFSLFLSFGSTFSLVFDFFYYYIPSFNKFRAPSMALAIMQFAVPILAGYGLTGIIKQRKETTQSDKKMINGFVIISGAFLVLGLLFSVVFKTSYIESVSGSANQAFQQYSKQLPDLAEFVYSQMISDWLLNGFLLVLMSLLSLFFVKGKIQKPIFFGAIAFILIFDLWRVDYRPMEVSDKPFEKQVFQKTDINAFLEQDKSVYRVADLSQRESPNALAYFELQNVNGYHSAKLRVYQDLMDVANLPQAKGSTSVIFNPFLWNLMNVKYILASGQLWEGAQPIFQSQQSKELIYYNSTGLPRAFWVDSLKVADPKTILHHLRDGDFNPKNVAWLEKSINQKIDTCGNITNPRILQYRNEYIKMRAKANGNNLLFISEIFYPSWKAFIDGKETEIYKTNFAFRSLVVPAGEHTIELRYESAGFETGKTLVLASNIIIALALALGIFMEIKKKKASSES